MHKVAQLFNSLDPSPFNERDLDPDAEEFVVDYARVADRSATAAGGPLAPRPSATGARTGLDTAFGNFFAYRAGRIELQLRQLFRSGRRHLAVGLPLLVPCLLASQYVGSLLDPRPWGRVIEESFIILDWVANWRPIEIFLYDWWPIRRDRDLYRRLASAPLEIKAQPHSLTA